MMTNTVVRTVGTVLESTVARHDKHNTLVVTIVQ